MTASIRQILVHFDAGAASPRRLMVARRIAQGEGAAVTALYTCSPPLLQGAYALDSGALAAADLIALEDERRDAARRAFDETCATPGPEASWAESDELPLFGAFVQQALYADLLVLGQPEPGDPHGTLTPPDFVPAIIEGSGKPALVLPYVDTGELRFDNVVIAWKPTREAARAITGALPLLARARHVHIVSWSEGEEMGAPRGHLLGLEGWLRLHGTQCLWHEQGAAPGHLGELLLSRAADFSADLLVLGCYGHSRSREWVLGGVTRTVLAAMTLPVLMAH